MDFCDNVLELSRKGLEAYEYLLPVDHCSLSQPSIGRYSHRKSRCPSIFVNRLAEIQICARSRAQDSHRGLRWFGWQGWGLNGHLVVQTPSPSQRQRPIPACSAPMISRGSMVRSSAAVKPGSVAYLCGLPGTIRHYRWVLWPICGTSIGKP